MMVPMHLLLNAGKRRLCSGGVTGRQVTANTLKILEQRVVAAGAVTGAI